MGRLAALEWLRSHRASWLRALLLLFLWLMLLDFPSQVADRSLDPSWKRCLGHFLANRYQCGVDYVWTYGPLGYLVCSVYDADLFWCKFAWEVGVKFALAWLLLSWSGLLERRWMQTAFVIVMLLFLPGSEDVLYLLGLVLLGLLPLRDENWRTPSRLVFVATLLAVLSLTKFTFFLMGTASWIVVVLAPGLGWRRRAVAGAVYPLAWVIVWLLLGQSLGNIPPFLASSWEIARGYGEAMATEGSPLTLCVGLTALVLVLALFLSYSLSPFRRRGNLLGLSLLSASMFLVWKHGFIRQDPPHESLFFGYVLFVPFAVMGLVGNGAPPSRLRVGLAAMVVIIGMFYSRTASRPTDWLARLRFNSKAISTPVRFKRALGQWEKRSASQWALPDIRRLVGDQTTDFISFAQGVLLLNRLNYAPRPVFQSYSAYTSDLLERNAAFYRSERAPAFVLCGLQTLDGHFPAMEDGPALLELFRRYRPVATEKGILLLKRRPDVEAAGPPLPVLLQRTIAFDEEVRVNELGAMPKLLSLRIDDSLLGRLRKAVYRPPPLFLHLRTLDGGTYSYRLIPGMASSNFLLDPFLRGHEDIEAFYAGRPLPRVRSFSVHVDPNARMYFQERMEITVRSEERLTETGHGQN